MDELKNIETPDDPVKIARIAYRWIQQIDGTSLHTGAEFTRIRNAADYLRDFVEVDRGQKIEGEEWTK